jgi:hypothetical protein
MTSQIVVFVATIKGFKGRQKNEEELKEDVFASTRVATVKNFA